MTALRPSFPKQRDKFDLESANAALHDLVYAVRDAAAQLGVAAFIPIGYVKITERDVAVMYEAEQTAKPNSQEVVKAATLGAEQAMRFKAVAA